MLELPATLKDHQEPQFLKGRDAETFPLGRYCERT
jgi:hypothetical protein